MEGLVKKICKAVAFASFVVLPSCGVERYNEFRSSSHPPIHEFMGPEYVKEQVMPNLYKKSDENVFKIPNLYRKKDEDFFKIPNLYKREMP
ncbi:hypothetical protein D6829_00495 [Candidatus Pacearchaeota archaeon]|nr:MAG: hypothetical protein D6829_00495 [Candidatus Pacearchaeota archaeon]